MLVSVFLSLFWEQEGTDYHAEDTVAVDDSITFKIKIKINDSIQACKDKNTLVSVSSLI